MAGANLVLNQKSSMPSHMSAHVAEQDAALHMGSSEYYSLQRSIFDAAFPFVTPRCKVVDLACSRGDWLAPIVERFEDLCHFVAVDARADTTYSCLDRFRMRVRLGFVEICQMDLAERFPETCSRVTISVMGIGRLSHERQSEVLQQTRRFLERGGAFIMAERVSSSSDIEHWERSLNEAGFRSVRKLWSKGGVMAWIASK
jgi:ubiquinone/menaquinone biosynthesis C-methylase UbiE